MNPPAAAQGGKPLRLLMVEDSEDDATLVMRELQRAGYDLTSHRVQAQEAFKAAIESAPWDVIVSDHTIPGYGGLRALGDLHAAGKDIPFILVSGTIGEAIAVRAMKAGAQDYVLKGDLTRLPAAIEREVRERAIRAEQARMREQIVMSERMASAGLLAAGVAHEINNPLAVAVANLDFTADMLMRLVTEARARGAGGGGIDPGWEVVAGLKETFDDAREALRRIRDIVRDVKLFSRPNDDVARSLDIRHVIDSAARMAWNEIRHRARLVKAYGETGPIGANESRLGQVLLNLIVNAAQAIPEGNADGNEIRVATKTSETGQVIVEVSDTGSGISKENLERIFDPFFTTKPVGVGTGLGLAISHRLVAELGGQIEVESEIGKGTLFRLTLPSAGEETKARISTPVPVAGRRARVLVVDDDAAVCQAIRRGLVSHHDVIALTSAEDALARIVAGERFDVILSDVMMPKVNGMALYEQIRQVAPEQAPRVVFLTGGAFTAEASVFLDSVPNEMLEKPFEREKLLAVIAKVSG